MDRKHSAHPLPIPLSAVEGVVWPAPMGGMQAVTFAALQQLEHSQYLPGEELQRRQFLQAGHLLRHAAKSLPFWRERLRAASVDPARPLDTESWAKLPILTRREVQDAGKALHATELPAQHGQAKTDTTSGSTGAPVTVLRSALALFYWNVFSLREMIWHDVDLSGKLVSIRLDWSRPAGSKGFHVTRRDNWGAPLEVHFATGPAALVDVRDSTPAEHAAFIVSEAPNHLVGFGASLEAIARHCIAHGIRVPSIRSVYSQGEVLSTAARAACREAWGVEVIDNYGSVEVGYIATQCPEHQHLHVHSESAIVEILRPDGTSCAPGEIGSVVVTPLHNFAMPLIRYALGDLAEVGPPCACGRTLPVITRVLGRERPRMVKLPGGREVMPYFGAQALAAFPAIIQHQVVQRDLDSLELRLVARTQLQAEEEERLRRLFIDTIGHSFRIEIIYCDKLDRSPSGKFTEFRCDIPD